MYILAVLPVLLALAFIPNLKALVPFSLAANVLIGLGLGITLYHLLVGDHQVSNLRSFPSEWTKLPSTFSITVFAMEAIGLVGFFLRLK